MEVRREREVVGVRSFVSEEEREVRRRVSMPWEQNVSLVGEKGGIEGRCTFEASRLFTDEFTFYTLAKTNGCFSCYVLLEEKLFHPLHGLFEILLRKNLAPNDITKESANGS